jgi:hypothetical protein
MLLTKELEVNANGRVQYYKNMGYEIYYIKKENDTRKYPMVKIRIEDLSYGSGAHVDVQCDYCGKVFQKQYEKLLIQRKNSVTKKDCCKHCIYLKDKETNLFLHGYESYFQSQEFKNYIKQYNSEKYGVEYYSQTEECKEKVKSTSLKNFGTESYFQTEDFKSYMYDEYYSKLGVCNFSQLDEIKEKVVVTNLERYGVKWHVESENFKEKNLKRYGVENPIQNKEIFNKRNKTFYNNGTCMSSIQQRYLCNLYSGELNYSNDTPNLDIGFPKEKIYIEYNGGGHNISVLHGNISLVDFEEKEKRRYYLMKDKGWKLIRIISEKDFLPNDNVLIELLNNAKEYLNQGHSWISFDIDKSNIICSEFEKQYDYGYLRKIS